MGWQLFFRLPNTRVMNSPLVWSSKWDVFFCCGMTKSHQLVKRTIVVTKKTARTVAAVSMAGLSQGKIYRWDCEMTPTDNITTAIGFQERIHETMCLETTHFSKVFFYLCFLKFEYEITNKTPGWILETVAIFRSAIQDGKIWMFQLPFLGHVQHWGPQEIFHVLN